MISFDLETLPQIVLMGRRICNINWRYSNYLTKNYELLFFYQGEAFLTVDNKSYTLHPGDCILLKPNQLFSSTTSKNNPCQFYIIHFNMNADIKEISNQNALTIINQLMQSYNSKEIIDVFDMPQINFKTIFLMDKIYLGEKSNIVYSILDRAVSEKNQLDINSDFITSCYLCEVLIQLSRLTLDFLKVDHLFIKRSNAPRLLWNALYYIHDNYSKQISIHNLSKQLDVSPQYLINIFKKYINTTPLQYIHMFRICRAKDMLEYTHLSIKEIANEIGMDNQHYFSRLFKKITGAPPSKSR